jgi:hypothetical protein
VASEWIDVSRRVELLGTGMVGYGCCTDGGELPGTAQPDGLRSATQRYLRDTAVIVTDLHAESRSVRVLDAMVTGGSMHTGATVPVARSRKAGGPE